MPKILVLGDDAQETNCLVLLLQFAGYSCEPASSPEEALALLREQPYQLALKHRRFGETRFDETFRMVRAVRPEIVTAALSEGGIPEAGADEVIDVPCSVDDLLDRIEYCLQISNARASTVRLQLTRVYSPSAGEGVATVAAGSNGFLRSNVN